jgi:cell division septal protein FtsQ
MKGNGTQKAQKSNTGSTRIFVLLVSSLCLLCSLPLCWVLYSSVMYLATAPRFEVKKLSVSGLKRVEENQILAKAGFAMGTNVFHVNLKGIRERVEELDWVRHAMIERILPDQIIIKVIEREPIGLARIHREIYQFDIDGKILDPNTIGASSFPVLDGLQPGDHKENLLKVRTYRRVLEDLGQNALSEIHINDAGEVTVVSASDPLLVNLGTSDFRSRWIKYLQLKPQIQQRYPKAVRVDLRFKNQVIVRMGEDDGGDNIVWDAKKNTL